MFRIKWAFKFFIIASNVDVSDIFIFLLPPWCIKQPKIVLDAVHQKVRTDRPTSINQQHCAQIRAT